MDRACGQWLPHAFRRRSIITTIARATSTPVAANLVSRVGLDDRDDDVQGWHDGSGELRVECEEENGLMAQQERSSRVMAEPAVVDIAAAGRRRPPEHGGGSHAPVAGGTMIGRGFVIKGDVSGNEDVEVEGEVVGTIELQQHVVTVGPGGRVEAQVLAKSVVVLGTGTGQLTAIELVRIGETGSFEGVISAPRVVIADGAHFQGRVQM